MKISVAHLNNEQLSNKKTLKHRNSGFKSVSLKNTPISSPKMRIDQRLRKDENYQYNALKDLNES